VISNLTQTNAPIEARPVSGSLDSLDSIMKRLYRDIEGVESSYAEFGSRRVGNTKQELEAKLRAVSQVLVDISALLNFLMVVKSRLNSLVESQGVFDAANSLKRINHEIQEYQASYKTQSFNLTEVARSVRQLIANINQQEQYDRPVDQS